MISRPRSILFWIILIVALVVVIKAPVGTAHVILAVYYAVIRLFVALGIFFTVLLSG
ncbi:MULTISPECIES: hypothetical protein [Streptomyces]|uniref:hypothetical protein n=1 Tax=Streptomyces TaxID=1883 RepID=UPI000AEAFBE9|nr:MULTISPECIES: hypothetical protein [Streptomyces]